MCHGNSGPCFTVAIMAFSQATVMAGVFYGRDSTFLCGHGNSGPCFTVAIIAFSQATVMSGVFYGRDSPFLRGHGNSGPGYSVGSEAGYRKRGANAGISVEIGAELPKKHS